MPLWRSFLFMPGDKEKMLKKSPALGADAVIWDLEDAVAPAAKPAARQLIRERLPQEGAQTPVYVRVNAVASGLTRADLEAVVAKNLQGVMLAKVESASEILWASDAILTLEESRGLPAGSVKIIALIESALGVLKSHEIASASPRLAAVSLGAEDLTADLGTSRSREGTELFLARSQIALAAAAARLAALDTIFADLGDPEGLERECRLARQLGFGGKCAIHPRQVEVINRAFAPSEAELAYARRVVTAFRQAEADNLGVIAVDGKMVDKPVLLRALRLLDGTQ